MTQTQQAVITPDALDRLIEALRDRGYRVLGPTVRDGAIVYDDLESAGELPIGWTDRQDGGTYRLERRDGRGALRLRRRSPFLEALPLSTPGAPVARPPRRQRHHCGRGGTARRDTSRLHRCPVLRAPRDRDPGHGLHRRQARRPGLRRPPRRCLSDRRELLRAGRHVLLHIDGDGAESRVGLRPGVDGAARRRASVSDRGGQ